MRRPISNCYYVIRNTRDELYVFLSSLSQFEYRASVNYATTRWAPNSSGPRLYIKGCF